MKKTERLFDIGVAALESATQTRIGQHACPLCLRLFPKTALESGELTLEHVPPKSQKGREIVLTCRACNNRAGQGPDAHVASRETAIAAIRAIAGHASDHIVKGSVRVGDHAVRVRIQSDGKRIGINVIGAINSPASIADYNRAMKELASAPEITDRQIHLKADAGYHSGKALIGDLKSAYLAAFATFGYSYVLQPGMQLLRDQIANPDLELIDRWWIEDQVLDRTTLRIAVADHPVRCVIVSLRRATVVLPIGEPTDIFYARFPFGLSQWQSTKFSGLALEWPRTLGAKLDFALRDNEGVLS